MTGKRVQFDEETWEALALARRWTRTMDFQEWPTRPSAIYCKSMAGRPT